MTEIEPSQGDFERELAVEEFELALTAEQQRYEESVRQIVETIQDRFARPSTEPGEELAEKVRVLGEGVEVLRGLAGKLDRLRAVTDSAERSIHAASDAELGEARKELFEALEQLDRHLPASGEER